jgi:hypothetical protein
MSIPKAIAEFENKLAKRYGNKLTESNLSTINMDGKYVINQNIPATADAVLAEIEHKCYLFDLFLELQYFTFRKEHAQHKTKQDCA